MKIKLTCPKCKETNSYTDLEYKKIEEFVAESGTETFNFVVCKDCGNTIEFFVKVKEE